MPERELAGVAFEADREDEDTEDDDEEMEPYRWEVRTVRSPDELEVALNLLSSEGWEIWAVYDRLSEWVIVAFSEE